MDQQPKAPVIEPARVPLAEAVERTLSRCEIVHRAVEEIASTVRDLCAFRKVVEAEAPVDFAVGNEAGTRLSIPPETAQRLKQAELSSRMLHANIATSSLEEDIATLLRSFEQPPAPVPRALAAPEPERGQPVALSADEAAGAADEQATVLHAAE
jgi:hypothetical protein